MHNFQVLLGILVALTYATARAQAAFADVVDMDMDKLKSQYLPAEFAKANFTLDDAKRMLRNKCKKAAAGTDNPRVYENIEQAAHQLMECATSTANLTQVLAEVEAARPVGELDVVFQRYCDKRPRAEQCLRDFNVQLQPCLTRDERAQNVVMMRILTSLLGFICYKNGDQIALFIAEEGPECIEANKDNISNCMNATFAAYMPKEGVMPSIMNELPELVMGPKQCIDLHDFEECVLGYLETCNDITPANIIESMFRYVKNEAKCQPEIDKAISVKLLDMRGGSNSIRAFSVVALMTAVSIVVGMRKFYI